MPDMQKNKKLKPWLTNKIDLEMEMKQLGLKKKDLRLDDTDQPVVLDVVNNPIDRVILQYLIIANNLWSRPCSADRQVPWHWLIPAAT